MHESARARVVCSREHEFYAWIAAMYQDLIRPPCGRNVSTHSDSTHPWGKYANRRNEGGIVSTVKRRLFFPNRMKYIGGLIETSDIREPSLRRIGFIKYVNRYRVSSTHRR